MASQARDTKGYYKLLGLEPNATTAEINKAYNRKQVELHPASVSRQKMRRSKEFMEMSEEKKKAKEAELDEEATKVNEAYNVLSDETKRQQYDNETDEFAQGFSGFSGFSGFQDIADFMSNFGGSRRSKGNKVEDTHSEIKITYKDVFTGKTNRYKVKLSVICQTCDGKGGKDFCMCKKCDGKGRVLARVSLGGLINTTQAVECPDCKGRGSKISGPPCSGCKGDQIVQEHKIIEVTISKGVKNGEQIVYKKQGNQFPGCVPGDIVFSIKVEDRPDYQRNGDDFICPVEIDILTALTGGVVYYDHLDGRKLAIKVQPFRDFESSLFVPSEGFTNTKTGKKGNLYLKPKVLINSGLDRAKLSEYIKPLLSKPSGNYININSSLKKCPEMDSVSEGDYEEDPRYSFFRGGINIDGGFPF